MLIDIVLREVIHIFEVNIISMALAVKDKMISIASSLGALLWGFIGGACGIACLATGCCGGTVLLGFLSLSGSTLGIMSKLTPVFLALTVLSLGYSFYQAYKPKKADCCATAGNADPCCNQAGSQKRKVSFFKSKVFLWLVTIACIGMWTYTLAFNTPKVQQSSSACCPAADSSTVISADTIKPCCEK